MEWIQLSLEPDAQSTAKPYQFYHQTPLLSFPSFHFQILTGVSDSSLSPFQLNFHISKELYPNPLSVALKALHVWTPTYLSNPIFHYFLDSTSLAKLNHSTFLYTPHAFPLPCLVHFIPSWNALPFFTLESSNTFHHLSRPSSNANNAFPGLSQVKKVSFSPK